MTLAAAEKTAALARNYARSPRLGHRLTALAMKRRLVETGWVKLAQSITVCERAD